MNELAPMQPKPPLNILGEQLALGIGKLPPHKRAKALGYITDPAHQDALRLYYKWHLADWIDHACYAHDPHSEPQMRKYELYPMQKTEITDWFELTERISNPDQEIKVWEKSRRVGWTNTLLLCLLHAAIFWKRSSIISTSSESVLDQLNNPQESLMARFSVVLNLLPDWLVPMVRDDLTGEMRHWNENKDRKHKEYNFGGASGAVISGLPSGSERTASRMARGSRFHYGFFDECRDWESSHLELAYNALLPAITIMIMISSSADNDGHFFSQLVDGVAIKGVKGTKIPYTANPKNDDRYLAGKRAVSTDEAFATEYLMQRGKTSNRIIKETNMESWAVAQSGELRTYKMYDTLITNCMGHKGYIYTAWDGGANSNYTACVLGWRDEYWGVDLLLKEFFIAEKNGAFDLAHEVKEWIQEQHFAKLVYNFEAFGDPALEPQNEHLEIEKVLGVQVNMLSHLKDTPHLDDRLKPTARSIFGNRKTARLQVLKRVMREVVQEGPGRGKPKVLMIKDNCPNLWKGLFDGGYQYLEKYNIITDDIAQHHPVCDLVDAWTYYLLATMGLGEIPVYNNKISLAPVVNGTPRTYG